MSQVYFLARLGSSDYLIHGCTEKSELEPHLERLGTSLKLRAYILHTVPTHNPSYVNNRIAEKLRSPVGNLLYDCTVEQVKEIMDESTRISN